LGRAEILDRGQQQRLAIDRGDAAKLVLRGRLVQPLDLTLLGYLEIGARPHLVKGSVKRNAAALERIGQVLVGQGSLQCSLDECVTGRLRARERACVATKKRKMSGDFGPDRHKTPSREDNLARNVCEAHWFR